jgi:hypothetical protein
MADTQGRPEPRRRIIVAPRTNDGQWLAAFKVGLVWMSSAVLHVGLVLAFIFLMTNLGFSRERLPPGSKQKVENVTSLEEDEKPPVDPTSTVVGNDPLYTVNYNVERDNEPVSVPGEVDPTQPLGVPGADPAAPIVNVPGPPGTGNGSGGSPDSPLAFGKGVTVGEGGGYATGQGLMNAFAGRSGGTRKKLLQASGGNPESEAAVARGLKWLALHQAPDGHWSLHEFHRYAHVNDVVGPGAKIYDCKCGGAVSRQNDIAATGFGLLPFLAAGQTHKPNTDKDQKEDYSKTVKAGLEYLIAKQGQNGYFGGDMYAHGIATIAMCEAYGMTSDPLLKGPAQKAVRHIVDAQHEQGGWRYSAKAAGDMSVTGWQLMALKSAQMAGLEVPKSTLTLVDRFLDSCENQREVTVDGKKEKRGGGYGYLPNSGESPAMTAVGLLCKQYLGVGPRNPGLLGGVERLKENPPGKEQPGNVNNIYYEYYATQVMHHMGGDSWEYWNKGEATVDGKVQKVHNGIRDSLLSRQDKLANLDESKKHQDGSWTPNGEGLNDGGRVMWTSLSLLSLEVYYRHLPLYRKDMGVNKEMEDK